MRTDRSEEVRSLFRLSVKELIEKSAGRLVVKENLEKLYDYLSSEMAAEFRAAAECGRPRAFIMPVGPTEPYRMMTEKINREGISLANCWFFFMDEYCDDRDRLIPASHPLSFRGKIEKLLFERVEKKLLMPIEQRIFPAPENLGEIPDMIERAGGIEVCYGGIGIHGHIAFNEPEEGVAATGPRILTINDFTRTVDSVRQGLGGNLVNFPRRAVTLGMKQCLGARRLLLTTRNEYREMDWANTVLRISVLGEIGDDYPVTHIRNHDNYTIATDRNTAEPPATII